MPVPRTPASSRPAPSRPASSRPASSRPARSRSTAARRGDERSTDLIRWAAFSCALVPVVLLWHGSSLAGATGTALGLGAVTAVCRLLLRRSERGTARLLGEEAGDAGRSGNAGEVRESRVHVPRAYHRGRHQRTGTGAHRGGRHTGGNSPVS
ncbi:hypothetical protein [Streptomyces sp. NPDC002588]|uniref:hypothetical protein n=1 Tax=Streptomyces sp. NPDC002588 TaxID=3154419 RepID=UPI0033212C98